MVSIASSPASNSSSALTLTHSDFVPESVVYLTLTLNISIFYTFDINDLPVEETAYLNKIVDAVLYDKEVPYHYSAESVYDDSITDVIGLVGQAQHPELYKMLHHLGLTKQDLEWVHSIELEEKIFVYVDDLDDFENQAAINLAKKRIHNALERKNK